MQWFKFRPTFEFRVDANRDQTMAKLQKEFLKQADRERFMMFGEYGELHLPPAELRLWSPHLSFYVLERQQACYIHGRFAPRLNVWTSVWIAYLALIFSAFFGAMLAYTQWTLGEPTWGLIVAAGSLLVVLGLYAAAHIGQQLSSDQMQFLSDELKKTLQQAGVAISP